jgi:hypothetical protein
MKHVGDEMMFVVAALKQFQVMSLWRKSGKPSKNEI